MSVMEMEQQPARVRRSFTDDFKADAVSMVLDDERRIVDVAGALGIGEMLSLLPGGSLHTSDATALSVRANSVRAHPYHVSLRAFRHDDSAPSTEPGRDRPVS